jgi:hypothetical protein
MIPPGRDRRSRETPPYETNLLPRSPIPSGADLESFIFACLQQAFYSTLQRSDDVDSQTDRPDLFLLRVTLRPRSHAPQGCRVGNSCAPSSGHAARVPVTQAVTIFGAVTLASVGWQDARYPAREIAS